MILERDAQGSDSFGMDHADARLVLPFDTRSRSRFRARLDNGEEVGVILARGHILRGGDRLRAEDGRVIGVAAASETVSTAHARDADMLARGAYHLGNRHVALQIGPLWLRYSHDHVLDDMVRGLGFTLVVEEAPFEPEGGAYHSHGGEGHHGDHGDHGHHGHHGHHGDERDHGDHEGHHSHGADPTHEH
jgi:urease accessory protein